MYQHLDAILGTGHTNGMLSYLALIALHQQGRGFLFTIINFDVLGPEKKEVDTWIHSNKLDHFSILTIMIIVPGYELFILK